MTGLPADTSEAMDAAAITAMLRSSAGGVHMVGVGGVGMSGLAFHLARRGFEVSGCDSTSNPLLDWLGAEGVEVGRSHDVAHIHPALKGVIRTAAVTASHPEVVRAKALHIPVWTRGEVLARLADLYRTVAVSGTHGKTTTATLVTYILRAAGLAPSFCIGGQVDGLGGVAGEGASDLLVAEADESDGSVALYHPAIAVVTNMEFDHMEHFADKEAFIDCFRDFVSHVQERVVFCADDPVARERLGKDSNTLSYGLLEGARVTAVDVRTEATSSTFSLKFDDRVLTDVALPLPGLYNIQNALGAAAVALHLQVEPDAVRDGLVAVDAPKRRFEIIGEPGGILVISDYAHHPTEIAALVQTARQLGRDRLLAVFQPHRYTRTRALGAAFPAAFEGVSEVVLAPVYAASEEPLEGGRSEDLYELFKKTGRTAIRLADSLADAWRLVRAVLRPGDALLVVGAGDVEQVAHWAQAELGERGAMNDE